MWAKKSPGEQCGRVFSLLPLATFKTNEDKENFCIRRPYGHTDGLYGQWRHQHLSLCLGGGQVARHDRRYGLVQGAHHRGGGRPDARHALQHRLAGPALRGALPHGALPRGAYARRSGHRKVEVRSFAYGRRHSPHPRAGGAQHRRVLYEPPTGNALVTEQGRSASAIRSSGIPPSDHRPP